MILFESPVFRVLVVVLGLSGLGYGGWWGVRTIQIRSALDDARTANEQGFPLVAADRLESLRHGMVQSAEGCAVLIDTYFRARQSSSLDWASQSCLFNKHETLEAFLGLATVRSWEGREDEALRILAITATRFQQSPVPHLRAAEIWQKNKKPERAVEAYQVALKLAPNDTTMSLNAMEYFRSVKRSDLVKPLAARLAHENFEQPEARVLVARSLKETGDAATAKQILTSVETALSKNPGVLEALKQQYSDAWK